MKKKLLFPILLVFGLTAAAQRWDQNLNSPILNSHNKQPLTLHPGKDSRIIPVNPAPGSPVINDAPGATGFNHDGYSSTNFDPIWANRFQTVLDSVRLATGMKGASLAVLVPGQGLFTCVSGISSPGVPVTTAMRFGIMSNTKLFIAVTMAKLQEQDVLSLDDHLFQWLPTYRYVDSTTTIRQLLSHQSGIFDYWNDGDSLWNAMLADTSHFFTDQEILASIKAPHFAPGHGYRYSNTNYLLAGMVIEAATGTTWVQKLHDFILNPLTMDSTFVGAFESRNGPVAAEWYGSSIAIINSPMTGEYSQANACGALLSTAQEMAAWYSALFSGAIISNSALQQILDFDPTSWYGLGLGESPYENHLSYNHTGGGLGYASQMWYDVQTQSVLCMLMNDRTGNFNNRVLPLVRVLYHDCPKKQNDAGISMIVAPWENSCVETRIPIVMLTNFGSNPLTSVNIKFQIDEGAPGTFSWSGALGTGDTVNVTLPQITAGEGIHKFTCYTTIPNGAPESNTYNDTSRSSFIVNLLPAAIAELSESFDGSTFPPDGWAIGLKTLWQWASTPLAQSNGTRSAVKNNYYDDHYGAHYDLDLPLIHIASATHPVLDFDYAYAMYPGYFGDTLKILISPDCGTTWDPIFNKGGQELSTSPTVNYAFYPQTSAEWKHESFSLAAYTGDVLIRFRDIAGFSNNLYLDEVKVSFPTGLTETKPFDNFTVYPNPTSYAVTISGLPVNSEVQLLDLSARLLLMTKIENSHTTIDIHALPQGVYILKTLFGTKKIVKM